MATGLRQRGQDPQKGSSKWPKEQEVVSKYDKKQYISHGCVLWTVLVGLPIAILFYIDIRNTDYPEPKLLSNARPDEFTEELARRHLVELTALGDRPVGSLANEKLAVQYLTEVFNEIKSKANSVHRIEHDSFRSSGSLDLNFLGHFTSVYENVNSIVLKLSPSTGAKDSLMINCHYDSVINGTGTLYENMHSCMACLRLI